VILVRIETTLAYILTTLALLISILSLILLLRDNLIKESFCKNFFLSLKIEENEINAEINKGKLVKAKAINYGFDDEYKIYSDGPQWVVVKPEKIKLESNQTGEIFVYLSPPPKSKGDYLFRLFLESFCQKKEDTILIHVV